MGQQFSNYQAKNFSGRLIAVLLTVFTLSFANVVKADIGLDYLAAQATAEGSYSNPLDIATSLQSTAETIHTLHSLNAIASIDLQKSASYLNADTVQNTEYLSRTIITNTLAGLDTSTLVTELLEHSNSDGGFGEFDGFESTALDTTFALQALAVSGNISSQTAGSAVAYLASKQNPDGGFSLSDNNESNIYVTSLSISALQRYLFQYNVSSTLSSATDFLFSKQLTAGGWGTDWQTAVALLAAVPITTDVTRYADAVTVLQTAQSTEGSWSNSIYATALALRVLHNIKNISPPVDVNTGIFTGRVVEETTNIPLAKVTVSLNDAANTTVLTDNDGSFLITDVPADDYTLSYVIAGYGSATQTAGISAGQRVDQGTIQLPRLADTGILSGIVTDVATGLPISGAMISTSGALTATVTTFTDGSFSLVSPPGNITISVSAEGYHSMLATGSIVAGSTLNFSPALLVSSTPPVSDPLISIFGNILDSATGLPISGAVVTLQNTLITATSNSNGEFSLTQVEPGELTLLISAADYIPVQSSILTTSGSNIDIGSVYLNKGITPVTSTVTGIVRDADTGLPISGVAVVVEGTALFATTDSEGKYTITNIQQLDFSLLASIPGYISQFTAVTLTEPTTTKIDFTLKPFSQEGLEIESFSTDQSSYPAYTPVLISASVRNSGTQALTVKVLIEVMNNQGEVIQQLHGGDLLAVTGIEESTVILPDALFELQSEWNTGIKPPGTYQISIKVFDKFSNTVLSERLTEFVIVDTKELEKATVSTAPKFTNVGAEQQVELFAHMVNRSNIEHTVNLQYQWLAPDGEVLKSGETSLVLYPDDVIKKLQITSFPYTFASSGNYPFNVQILTEDGLNTQESSLISVAPTVRIEIEQSINPIVIVPDDDKRIDINIRLKGVEQ